jgi:hypothetical protein
LRLLFPHLTPEKFLSSSPPNSSTLTLGLLFLYYFFIIIALIFFILRTQIVVSNLRNSSNDSTVIITANIVTQLYSFYEQNFFKVITFGIIFLVLYSPLPLLCVEKTRWGRPLFGKYCGQQRVSFFFFTEKLDAAYFDHKSNFVSSLSALFIFDERTACSYTSDQTVSFIVTGSSPLVNARKRTAQRAGWDKYLLRPCWTI